jgi:cysteine desulfurase/selenocysteine lyase
LVLLEGDMPAWSTTRNNYPALRTYVYLDTAGTGIVSRATARIARQYYADVSGHGNSRLESMLKRMDEAREEVAALIKARPGEIAFAPNTSHGMNMAALMLRGQGTVVVPEPEFPSSTIAWLNQGFRMRFVKSRKNIVHLEDLDKAIGRRRKGIVVHSFVQYSTGFRQDMAKLGEICRRRGHFFVANITQGCGAFPVDVKKWGVDFACCTGIKWLCAGEGAGFFYVRKELLKKFKAPLAGWFSVKKPMKLNNRSTDLKEQASRFEVGGPAFPNIFALGSAAREIRRIGVQSIAERIRELTDYLLEKLRKGNMAVASPVEPEHRSGIVLIKAVNPVGVVDVLRARQVKVSARGDGIRVSTHFYNNKDDIDRLVYHLKRLL